MYQQVVWHLRNLSNEMKIKNYNHIESSNKFDIIHREKVHQNECIFQSSELIIEINGIITRIKFELAKGNEIDETDVLFVPETNFLFYRGNIEWCVFDLNIKKIKRHEDAFHLPFLERRDNVILIYDDLYVESTDLEGNRIDNVPVDPPTESVEFEDRIEFNSPVFGKRTLRLIK